MAVTQRAAPDSVVPVAVMAVPVMATVPVVPMPVVTPVPMVAAVMPVAPIMVTPVPVPSVMPAGELHHRGWRRGVGGHGDRKWRRAGGRARQAADQRGQEDQDRPGSHRLSPVLAPG